MMKIAYDIQPLAGPDARRGIGTYTYHLLDAMLRNNEGAQIILMGREQSPPENVRNLIDCYECIYKPLPLTYPAADYLRYSPLCPFDSASFLEYDIYHVTSPLMFDSLIPCWSPCAIVATVYDIIPLIYKQDQGQELFPAHLWRNYEKRIKTVRDYDGLLCISEKTAEDTRSRLLVSDNQVTVIHTGINKAFFTALKDSDVKHIIHKWNLAPHRYIFTVGGFNPRKNMENHFIAFKKFLDAQRDKRFKYVVTCRLEYSERNAWLEIIKRIGIKDHVVLTNEVSDEELHALYSGAASTLFLSRYEGFGLPVAESIISGTAVVASEITTNREILGDSYEYLVLPDAPDKAAELLERICERSSPSIIRPVADGVRERYTWDAVAERCKDAYRKILEYRRHSASAMPVAKGVTHSTRPRVAVVSPVASSVSGIADYIKELLPHLAISCSPVLLCDDPFHACTSIVASCDTKAAPCYVPARHLSEMVKLHSIDLINYQLGNNITHAHAYFSLRLFPGIVTLHDLSIAPFIFEISRDISPMIIQWEIEGLGDGIDKNALFKEFITHWHLDYDTPLLRNIRENARGIIVHNTWMSEKLAMMLGKDQPAVYVVPMGIEIPERPDEATSRTLRGHLGLNEKSFIILIFGNITPNKRLEKSLEAFTWFHRIIPNSALVVVGAFLEARHREYIMNTANFYNISKAVRFMGFLEGEQMDKVLAISDIAINLRYPTFGETSATLLRAMAMGLPCLVSDINQYREFPDGCTFKIPPDTPYEVDTIIEYLRYFASHRDELRDMGGEARDYVRAHHTLEHAAQEYSKIFNQLL